MQNNEPEMNEITKHGLSIVDDCKVYNNNLNIYTDRFRTFMRFKYKIELVFEKRSEEENTIEYNLAQKTLNENDMNDYIILKRHIEKPDSILTRLNTLLENTRRGLNISEDLSELRKDLTDALFELNSLSLNLRHGKDDRDQSES